MDTGDNRLSTQISGKETAIGNLTVPSSSIQTGPGASVQNAPGTLSGDDDTAAQTQSEGAIRRTSESKSSPEKLAAVPVAASAEGRRDGDPGSEDSGLSVTHYAGPSGRHEEASDARSVLSPWRIESANRRLKMLEAFWALVRGPKRISRRRAAQILETPYISIYRYEKLYLEEGYTGLIPDVSSGRKTVLENLGFEPDQVKELMAKCEGLSLDTESTVTALRLFASSDRCPEMLANVILDPNRSSKHSIPPSIRRAATPSKNSRLAHRGSRSLDLRGFWIPRKRDILPGDIFCPDDTTPIFGWWVPWIQNEEYPFGVKLLQGQLLRIIDVASQCPVGKVLIAREKSSYRASDIWAWVGFMAEDVGLPRLGFQMERGSWDATLLQGFEVEAAEGDPSHGMRVGGLRQLPSNITDWHRANHPHYPFQSTLQTWTSYLPKSKSIEAYFDRSQTLEGCLYGCLGRDQMRRPYEKAKKMFQQCSRPKAKIDAREHFLSGTELMARLGGMDEFLANEPMEGEVFKGIPRLNFQNAISERPLFHMPEESRWLYRSDWKPVRIISGWARVRLTHPVSGERYSIYYCNPRVFAEIEGRDVVVYYDRENFEKPAQIVAASRFAACGREFYPGDYVCEAEHFHRPGMFLDGDTSGYELHKKWRGAVMTIYGRASVHAPSRQLPPEIAARRAQAALVAPVAQVDGRPAAAPVPKPRNILAAPSPAELEKRRRRLAEAATISQEMNPA